MTEIRPALTAEEWQRMLDDFEPAASLEANATAYEPDFFMAMAVANAALPDDDPRKITRDDILTLTTLTHFMTPPTYMDSPLERALYRLRAKLAALLPPNGH